MYKIKKRLGARRAHTQTRTNSWTFSNSTLKAPWQGSLMFDDLILECISQRDWLQLAQAIPSICLIRFMCLLGIFSQWKIHSYAIVLRTGLRLPQLILAHRAYIFFIVVFTNNIIFWVNDLLFFYVKCHSFHYPIITIILFHSLDLYVFIFYLNVPRDSLFNGFQGEISLVFYGFSFL